MFGIASGASAASIYTVADVGVDVTAESAAKARQSALAEAHQRAFDRLIGRIVPAGAQEQVPQVSYDRIATLTRDFEVSNEKTSSVRYLADLTIRFQRQAVRGFLRKNAVPFAETRSKPVVVLPLFGAAGDAVLWNDPNPWRKAWGKRDEDGGLVPLVVPLGDLQDIRAVSAQDALNQRQQRLDKIAARYDAGDVLVTQAIPAGDAQSGTASAQIVSRRVDDGGRSRTWVNTVRQQAEESRGEMYARAAEMVAAEVERTWKLTNVVRFESEAMLTARVPLESLDRWVSVRERLNEVPVIGDQQLRRLSRGEAIVELVYYGDLAQLRRALSQTDLVLEEAGTGRDGDGGSDGGSGSEGPPWIIRSANGDASADASSATN